MVNFYALNETQLVELIEFYEISLDPYAAEIIEELSFALLDLHEKEAANIA